MLGNNDSEYICLFLEIDRKLNFYRLQTGKHVVHLGQELIMEGLICETLEETVAITS